MTNLDNFGEAYLSLVLEIDKHIDGYIDAYSGPPDLKAAVAAAPKKPIHTLHNDLAHLQESLPTGDLTRHAYLNRVLRAIACTIRMLDGKTFDYLEEVNRIFDISPQQVDEAVFEAGHRALEDALPGSGPLAVRLDTWRKQYDITPEKLPGLLDLARAETRKRTLAFVDLLPGETVEISLTNDQPWSAYNWYKGNSHSLIEFNTDIPVSALGLADLFAHEGYPGHHTEHMLKEQRLYHEMGYAEHAAMLLHSPSAVIAEGIATHAVEIIFPDGSHHDWTAEVIVPAAGLPPVDAAQLRQISAALRSLNAVSGNAAILYHTGKLNAEQAVEYLQVHGLSTETRARKSFEFMTHPLFRAYIFTYTQGYTLIKGAAHGGDLKPLFKRLLTEQILPSQLASM